MTPGRSTKIISMIKWIRTSRLSKKKSFSLHITAIRGWGLGCGPSPQRGREERQARHARSLLHPLLPHNLSHTHPFLIDVWIIHLEARKVYSGRRRRRVRLAGTYLSSNGAGEEEGAPLSPSMVPSKPLPSPDRVDSLFSS